MVIKKHFKVTIDCSFGSDFQEEAVTEQLVNFIKGMCQFYEGMHKNNDFTWVIDKLEGESQRSKKLKEERKKV